MKFLSIVLMISTMVSCSSNSKKDMEQQRADIFYEEGTRLLINGSYTDALQKLNAAVRLRPNDSKILNNLGMAYYFKKKPAIALELLRKSIEIDSKNSDALTNIAGVFMTQKNYPQAKKYYEMVLKDIEYEGHYRVHYNLALIDLKQGKTTQGVKKLKLSIKSKKDYCPAHYKLGEIYYENKRYKPALKMFKNATKGTCVSLPAPHFMQAMSYYRMEELSKANEKFLFVRDNHPETKFGSLSEQYQKELHSKMDPLQKILSKEKYKFNSIKKAQKTETPNF